MAKKDKVKSPPAVIVAERDGRPAEIERYGDPAKLMYRDNASSALGWLITKGHLNSRIEGERTERALEIAWSEGRSRINTAIRLEEIFEKAQIAPIRSPDFEAVPDGTFGPRDVSARKLDCIRILARLQQDIPSSCMAILRLIIVHNLFIWHGLPKQQEQDMLECVRMSIDFAAWSLDRHHRHAEITDEELIRRWPAAHDWLTMRRLRVATLFAYRDSASDLPGKRAR